MVHVRRDLADLPQQLRRVLLRPSWARSLVRRSQFLARSWLSHEAWIFHHFPSFSMFFPPNIGDLRRFFMRFSCFFLLFGAFSGRFGAVSWSARMRCITWPACCRRWHTRRKAAPSLPGPL